MDFLGVNKQLARTLYIILAIFVVSLLSLAGYRFSHDQFEKQAVETSRERLILYRATLRSTLERISHLPTVVRLHKDTKQLLNGQISADETNQYLKKINDAAASAAVYILDEEADTLAASNFDTDESFVGNNYRFRRYFTDAIETGNGRFFAVGVTTGRPGYFVSEAIYSGTRPIGVAVVKVEFLELLEDWKGAGENVLITDRDGVIVLASNYDHLYKTLYEISESRLKEMQETRKFSDFTLAPLGFSSANGQFENEIELDEKDYVVTTVDTSGIGWKLHFLTPLETVRNSAFVFASIILLTGGLAIIGFLYAGSRLQRDRLKLIEVEAERVNEANKLLQNEIEERQKTEKMLRDTQAELIQSSRLAALGKMSAAIVHEVNQPVSAIRMFTSSGNLLLTEKRFEEAGAVFSEIRKMTERLGTITSDLLIFSRKPVTKPKLCDLNQCVENILRQYRPELEVNDINIALDLADNPVRVRGSEVRFEQLFSNLLKNALQAGKPDQRLTIEVRTWQIPGMVGLTVVDNGSGVSPEIMDQLFDPFFTTKDIGKGVGLGLALCYAIADEAGGRIYCENNETGGASFHVEFPVVENTSPQEVQELEGA